MTDCQLVILGPFGRITLNHVTGFVEEQLIRSVTIGSDGRTQTIEPARPEWSATFQTDERDTRAVDDLFGLLEAEFFSQTKEVVEVYRYDPDGARYHYPNARLSLAPGGGVAFLSEGRVRV